MAGPYSCFITGTDTEVGKTLISAALLHLLRQQGVKVAAMKPIAAGAAWRDGTWHNDDVDMLAAEAAVPLPLSLTTPYLLREAAAPHIAAGLQGITIDPAYLRICYDQVAAAAEAVVVEGVGGFRVPLAAGFDTADLARQLDLPVIMVVGLRLGCLNHALLTADAIAAGGLRLAGWVANGLDPAMPHAEANVDALGARLPAPLIGCVPWLSVPAAAAAAAYLDISRMSGWSDMRIA